MDLGIAGRGGARRRTRRRNQRMMSAMQGAQQQAPAPPTSTETDQTAQLQKLAELKNQGILTEEEFTEKKKQILGI